jgi:hypothetical protein
MIKEDTMIKIAEKFFERENIKPIRQKTGVDFIFQGKAIEVKGSNSKFNRSLSQFLDYALKYSGLTLIFPTDFLSNPSRLFNFHLWYTLASKLTQRSIEVVLVSESDEFYYLKKSYSAHSFISDINDQIVNNLINKKKGMKEIFENLNSYIQKAFSRIVEEKPDMIIPKSIIQ